MKKIYYLKTCDTCKKILKQIEDLDQFELQEIKSNPVTEPQLEEIYAHTKSYEALFNKRAQLYKQLGLKDQKLSRSEEHTSELQSRPHLVCRLLLEKKKK